MFIPSKRTLLVTTAVFTIAGSGAALAYWTQSGTGSGSAQTANGGQAVEITNDPIGQLTPGVPVNVPLKVKNPNSFTVQVGSVTVAIGTVTVDPTVQNGANPPCTAADFEVTEQPAAINGPIFATETALRSAKIRLINSTTLNQDNCKNASVALTYTSN